MTLPAAILGTSYWMDHIPADKLHAMPVLVFRSPSDPVERWQQELENALPGLEVRIWPDIGDPAEVDYALIWAAPDDMLHELPNLRLVFSVGAGVDHLLGETVPRQVPIVRMVDPALTEGMVEYVVYQVLRHHRGMPVYEDQQARAQWLAHDQARPGERGIGILGLGQLGSACGSALAHLGFRVAGHSRSRRRLDGIDCHAGPGEFTDFLAASEFLICLLPLTAETRGILNADLFAALPRGAVLIHAGRGAQLVESDLHTALDEGRLAHAVLDVFAEEPLPGDHAFWSDPRVTVTPHVASLTNPVTGAARVADGIRSDLAGHLPEHVVDRERGY